MPLSQLSGSDGAGGALAMMQDGDGESLRSTRQRATSFRVARAATATRCEYHDLALPHHSELLQLDDTNTETRSFCTSSLRGRLRVYCECIVIEEE